MEFYLIKPNLNPNEPIEPPLGRTGRQMVSRQAYSMSAVDEYGKVIDDIYEFAEAQGFEIDTIIQEGGAGQVEINLLHGDPVKLADQVFFFKRTIREAALRNNCFATFMAKPMQDEPGSAMHIHQSVVDVKTGRNIFTDAKGAPTEAFYSFLAGQQRHIPTVVCMLAPYVNSYRRYVPHGSAPINLEWGPDNRTTGLRIPISEPARAADREPGRRHGLQPLPRARRLARLRLSRHEGRAEAARAGRRARPTTGRARCRATCSRRSTSSRSAPRSPACSGEEFCNLYKAIKRDEVETFLRVISPWERDHLLLNV